jgi:phage antirepressor YoqD-like protein
MKKKKALLSSTTYSVAQTGKATKFPGGEIQFFAWLRLKGYLISDNTPAQKYINAGWFEVKTTTLQQINPPQVVLVTRVTIKGLASLERIVRKEFPICEPCR